MAYNTIFFKNPITGQRREAPVGFSWTCFFFGFFPALLRSDWKWGGLMGLFAFLTFGFSWFLFPFIYNKFYIKELVNNGYQFMSVETGTKEQIEHKIGLAFNFIQTGTDNQLVQINFNLERISAQLNKVLAIYSENSDEQKTPPPIHKQSGTQSEKIWWYARGDKQFGPCSAIELKAIAKSGEIVSTDLVWKEGLSEWKPASSIKGLIP